MKESSKVEEAALIVSRQASRFSRIYSENSFNRKLLKYGAKLGSNVLYPVILLYTAMSSPATSSKDKIGIMAALGYFILPMDLIPDFLSGIGYADDMAAVVACLKLVKHILTPEVFDQTDKAIEKIFGTSVDTAKLRDFISGLLK